MPHIMGPFLFPYLAALSPETEILSSFHRAQGVALLDRPAYSLK
jgi:hypothetical protein